MLKRTVLFDRHQRLNAKLIDFGGFEMPLQYAGIRAEHLAVRESAGLFDVSHMGEFFVQGPGALAFLQTITINDVSRLVPGKAQYSAMCYPSGGIVDDLIVYRLGEEEYMLVVNAANIQKDWEWITSQDTSGVTLVDRSPSIALLALQGPAAASLLQPLTDGTVDCATIPYYGFQTGRVCGQPDVIISATGYTGEKGFELYIDTENASAGVIWDALIEAGASPIGLGARDTLRLEMGYALYGNDITADTTPLEGGLGWITKMDKGDFIGRREILAQKESGVPRTLVGFVIEEARQIPRHGHEIFTHSGERIGEVTSGSQSILMEKGIGLGWIRSEHATPGSVIMIGIRGKHVPAVVTRPPFIPRRS